MTMYTVTRGGEADRWNMLGVLGVAVEVRDGLVDPEQVSVVPGDDYLTNEYGELADLADV